ncbi:NAD(P)-dependent oxidoreductase [Streptomyces sp. BI20]|uniref:NAD(P)-dependent oxidoreductase n=1 Tax=Streptomyces sp. BI20 TaxID=3403460 RepID=UPI003C74175E
MSSSTTSNASTGAVPSPSTVTVLGLGPMGKALAGAFADAGARTTVWNRTPGKDAESISRGAVSAASAVEAVSASDLIVVSVVNQAAVDAVLRDPEVAAALKGRTVFNLTADTPERARGTAAWAAEQGIDYVDGAIMSPAPTIGTPHGVFLYSGPTDLYKRHESVLALLDGSHTYLGEEIGRAAAFDLGLLDLFWTAIGGFAHSVALAQAEGVSAKDFAPFAAGITAILPALFADAAEDLERGEFPGTVNPLTSAASSMAHIVESAESHGIDSAIMRSVEGLTHRAIGLGHGGDGFARLAELLGRRG